MSASSQTSSFARDRLKLVPPPAQRYLSSLMEEVKTIVNWLSEDDELNQYRLRIYWVSWTKAIVIVSDITSLPGRKIADLTLQIIRLVKDCFDLFPNQIMLVEHYSISNVPNGDVYFHLLSVNNEVIRYDISEDELTCLIGLPIKQE